MDIKKLVFASCAFAMLSSCSLLTTKVDGSPRFWQCSAESSFGQRVVITDSSKYQATKRALDECNRGYGQCSTTGCEPLEFDF